MFKYVAHIFYYTFYALEDNGIIDLNNTIDMFSLQLAFLPRINKSLLEFRNLFNDHPIRTERNWSPNQMWTNGMLHPQNPLGRGEVDETVVNTEHYGIDHDGPSPFEDSGNNVQVSGIEIEGVETDYLTRCVLQEIDPLMDSQDMGINVILEVKNFVSEFIRSNQ